MSKSTLEKAFDKAKIGLLSREDSVFLTTVLFSLRQCWDKSIPTAATDCTSTIWYNPDSFMALSPDQRMSRMAHETWHVAFMHSFRKEGKDHSVWNQACDHVINLMLVAQGFVPIKTWLMNPKFKGMGAEQVYKHLMDNPEDQQSQPEEECLKDPGSGEPDNGSGDQPTPTQALENARQKIVDTLVRAQTLSKISGDKAGTIPNDIEVALADLLDPVLPWEQLLLNYLTGIAQEDYSFTRINKRFMHYGHYLPGLYSEGLGKIGFGVDSSGSVGDHEFNVCRSEMHYVQDSMNPESVTVVSFDSKVQTIDVLEEGDRIEDIVFTGRGGTKLKPMMDYFIENPPEVLVVLSDMECTPLTEDPGFPVIWVCYDNPNAKVNFGTLIHFTIN